MKGLVMSMTERQAKAAQARTSAQERVGAKLSQGLEPSLQPRKTSRAVGRAKVHMAAMIKGTREIAPEK